MTPKKGFQFIRTLQLLTTALCAAVTLGLGCVDGGGERATDEDALATVEQGVASSTRQFASYYVKNAPLRNAPSTDLRRQWSSVVINNPNPTNATVTLTIHRNDGAGTLAVFTKTIPARGWYNSYGQADWLAVGGSMGWVELTSDVPVVATNQVTVRSGSTYDAPVAMANDLPFLKAPSTRLLSTFFLRKWPSGMTNITQWTEVTVNNPNAVPASITVRVHRSDGGGLHAVLTRTVPARGAWDSAEDLGWRSITPTDPNNGGAIGWLEVLSDQPVVASSQVSLRNGTIDTASPILLDDTPFEPQPASVLHAPLFLKGASGGGTLTQWSTPVVVNPNPTPTTLTVVVRNDSAQALASFTRTIPAMGWWNAYGDAGWSGATGSMGWAELSASQPVFGVNRVVFRDGTTSSSPVKLQDDEPLAQTTAGLQFTSLYLKKWPSTIGYTQWTDLVVNNPDSASPVAITVRILRIDRSDDLTFFTRQIPPRGTWRSSTDAGWLSLPNSEPANGRSVGWIEVSASAPVTALSRTSVRSGDTATSSITNFEDTLFQGNIGSACDPQGPGVFCPVSTTQSSAELVREFKELVIVDPSVLNDGRASNALNGPWSFRWLVEQMVTPGHDPSVFVENWLKQGFNGGTFNGFGLTQRQIVDHLFDEWPKLPGTNRLDLSQSPFKLLAIVNRGDLASTSSAGEGRFVFGLDQPDVGQEGQRMTVIFEYKLPASASRQVWAQRFHALGALSFGESYNARLQMITDEYARRGANPNGVNGSALGTLRTNELLAPAFLLPWQWREFQLVAGSPARLQVATTKQTPHDSLNGSTRLTRYVSDNAQAILDGTAIVPEDLLGGESNAGNNWVVPGVSEEVRRAFARQTCNGCHTGDGGQAGDVLDDFYHVSPLRTGGPDGTARLSNFLLTTDLPLREKFMKATLCAGTCPSTELGQATSFRVH